MNEAVNLCCLEVQAGTRHDHTVGWCPLVSARHYAFTRYDLPNRCTSGSNDRMLVSQRCALCGRPETRQARARRTAYKMKPRACARSYCNHTSILPRRIILIPLKMFYATLLTLCLSLSAAPVFGMPTSELAVPNELETRGDSGCYP